MFGLSPPWVTYYKKIVALFQGDNDITVSELASCECERATYKVTLTVAETSKASALQCLLNSRVEMGNITVLVDVLDSTGNKPTPINAATEALVELAFKGNPLFCRIYLYKDVQVLGRFIYCIFKKDIIQFFNDNLSDYAGNFNGTVAEVVAEICVPEYYHSRIFYCTESDRQG